MNPFTVRTTGLPSVGHPRDSLLARLCAGEERACEELLRRHGGRMLALARRLLADEPAAAEALEVAFLSAFRSVDRCASEAELGTWLQRIVVDTCLGRLRDPSSVGALEGLLPAFDAHGNHARGVCAWPAPRRVGTQELHAEVRRCIARLPAAQRVPVLLHDVEQLSLHEVATRLGITSREVEARLHEARQALITLLGPVVGVMSEVG